MSEVFLFGVLHGLVQTMVAADIGCCHGEVYLLIKEGLRFHRHVLGMVAHVLLSSELSQTCHHVIVDHGVYRPFALGILQCLLRIDGPPMEKDRALSINQALLSDLDVL